VRIDDPELVRREYETERTLVVRNRVFRGLVDGVDAEQIVLDAVAEIRPVHVLEVGCGTGELAARMKTELACTVTALDLSPRMVELTRARGVEAQVGDVQELPFRDGQFDVAVAAWMLYHVPDLDRGLLELRRVVRPGGRLVAATFGRDNLQELRDVLGDDGAAPNSFRTEEAEEPLRRHFDLVERRDAPGWIRFPDHHAVREYVAASIKRRHLVDRVPEFDGPLLARSSQAVFAADRAR
jgi:SAM-dependent methyltransferase